MEQNYLTLNNNCLTVTGTLPDTERELAILFLDIRNFTGLMESQPGQKIILVLRKLFSTFSKIIGSFNGKVVEVAGDNLYAVFGLQTNLREAANQAYQAARVMFQTIGLFNEAYAIDNYGNPIEMGVGLHTGKVFIGESKWDESPKLSVMGLPVNIASRLQAKTKELNNDMLISEDAYSLLQAESAVFDEQTIHLQGLSSGQKIRLAGKPYTNKGYLGNPGLGVDYILAISG